MTNRSAGAGRDGKLRELAHKLHHLNGLHIEGAGKTLDFAEDIQMLYAILAVPDPLASSSETQGEIEQFKASWPGTDQPTDADIAASPSDDGARQPQELSAEQVRLLAWAVSNCHTLARRRIRAGVDLEYWEHVKRICEKAGAQSKGVLRASLPTEITEGSGESEHRAWFAGNEQAWKDLAADGGLPESHPAASDDGAAREPQQEDFEADGAWYCGRCNSPLPPAPARWKPGERELHNLMDSVQIEDDRIQALGEELKIEKPEDRQGYTGRYTAFDIIAALRKRILVLETSVDSLRYLIDHPVTQEPK